MAEVTYHIETIEPDRPFTGRVRLTITESVTDSLTHVPYIDKRSYEYDNLVMGALALYKLLGHMLPPGLILADALGMPIDKIATLDDEAKVAADWHSQVERKTALAKNPSE